MGGNVPGQFRGSAPGASFILLQTEDVSSEFRIEEANWLAGAEFADSLGSDVINSSLGYSIGFSDPVHNYEYSQMDGRTALVSRAATIASRKGIIVVTSAGNSGRPTNPWKYITAPADADTILGIGAVDAFGRRADFSSRGYSADGRIKPDVMAQGVGTWMVRSTGVVGQGNGTSFSSPVTAGMVACFWQSMPEARNYEIIESVRRSGSLNPFADSLFGYGIPNLDLAGWILTSEQSPEYKEAGLTLFPNPAGNVLYIRGKSGRWDEGYYEIIETGGRRLKAGNLEGGDKDIQTISLQGLPPGTYILNIRSETRNQQALFIKL
jgi:subtilisin family serine protease